MSVFKNPFNYSCLILCYIFPDFKPWCCLITCFQKFEILVDNIKKHISFSLMIFNQLNYNPLIPKT